MDDKNKKFVQNDEWNKFWARASTPPPSKLDSWKDTKWMRASTPPPPPKENTSTTRKK